MKIELEKLKLAYSQLKQHATNLTELKINTLESIDNYLNSASQPEQPNDVDKQDPEAVLAAAVTLAEDLAEKAGKAQDALDEALQKAGKAQEAVLAAEAELERCKPAIDDGAPGWWRPDDDTNDTWDNDWNEDDTTWSPGPSLERSPGPSLRKQSFQWEQSSLRSRAHPSEPAKKTNTKWAVIDGWWREVEDSDNNVVLTKTPPPKQHTKPKWAVIDGWWRQVDSHGNLVVHSSSYLDEHEDCHGCESGTDAISSHSDACNRERGFV